MSQERQPKLRNMANSSGDYIGVGCAADGRAVALYAQTRLRPYTHSVPEKPLFARAAVGGEVQHPNIAVVGSSIAVANGEHLGLLVRSLAREQKPTPMLAFNDWAYAGIDLSLPKLREELAGEAHMNDRLYTARIGAAITVAGAAMFAVREKNGHPEQELAVGPAAKGRIRITGTYENNTFTPGDYVEYVLESSNPLDVAQQFMDALPPTNPLYKRLSVLFYDLAQRRGELVEASMVQRAQPPLDMVVLSAAPQPLRR